MLLIYVKLIYLIIIRDAISSSNLQILKQIYKYVMNANKQITFKNNKRIMLKFYMDVIIKQSEIFIFLVLFKM